jgi:hypothetical protein
MIKKDVVVAVLATFCLTIVLVTAVPVGSIGTYNPWLDSPSEDGKIDVRDVAPVAAAYGTTGDPTKNVNVTNWPYELNTSVTNWPDPSYKVIYLGSVMLTNHQSVSNPMDWCFTGGYSGMSLRVQVVGYYVPSGYWGKVLFDYYETAFDSSGLCTSMGNVYGTSYPLAYVYSNGLGEPVGFNLTETQGPYFRPKFYYDTTVPYEQYTWVTFAVYVYLRNE